VRANDETMLFMMACTLLQMSGADELVASEGAEESRVFAEGVGGSGLLFSAAEAWLLNFAFFDPELRRQRSVVATSAFLSPNSPPLRPVCAARLVPSR
jgi:hypothetical protein